MVASPDWTQPKRAVTDVLRCRTATPSVHTCTKTTSSFFLVMVVVSAAHGQPTQPRDLAAEQKPPRTQSPVCEFRDAKLPADYVLYAAGGYSGRPVGFQIDQSGHEATQIDVEVNNRERPVVLMLGAYEPSIWNISWSEGTRIHAVIASGYHRQVIAGLAKETPTVISTYDNRGACGYFYVTPDSLASLNPQARKILGRAIDTVYFATNGQVVIGTPTPTGAKLITSRDSTPRSFFDPTAPLAGPPGIEDAVRKGLLRKATLADAEAWSSAVAENSPNRDIPPVAGQGIPPPSKPYLSNAYIVLKPFTYPAGLNGGHSATFLIPKGSPKPSGNPGHSAIYDFNSLNCSGALCREEK